MGRPLFGAQPTRPHHGDLCSCNTCMPLPPDTHLWSAPARSSTPTPSGEPSDDSEGRPRSPSTSAPASSLDVYTQTRDSLRLASTALDAAYTRLRELRIAIRGLSAASDGMSPGHTAIVLSGGEGATTDNAMPESSPAETGLLRIPNISSIRRDDARASLSHNAHSVLDPPEPSPLEPIRSPASSTVVAVDQSSTMSQGRLRQLRTRRSLLEDHLRLRREDTLGVIGRRATARAAVETASATGSRAEETQSLYDRSIQIANELEQTIDRYLSNRRLLSNALATGQRTSALARMDEVSRIGRSNSEGVGSISPTEQPASSRSRVVPPARRVTSNTPRLSLGLRALDIFQRHHTNPTDSLNNPTSGPTLPRPQRSFRDNDTSTSVDDLDDTMSWLMRPRDNAYERFLQVADGQDAPREPAHNRGLASETGEDADQDGLLATTSPQTRRRRWALLDEDGNEIQSDERDPIERVHSENSLIPTTRNSISYGTDDEIRIARVRLNTHRLQLGLDTDGGHTTAVASCPGHGCALQPTDASGSSIPYRVIPLPLPIEQIVCTSRTPVTGLGKERRIVTRGSYPTTGIGR